MYTLHRLITWLLILVSPARLVAALPLTIPATVSAHAAQITAPYHLTLDTAKSQPVTIQVAARPNFDTEVLEPLHKAQAEAAAQAAAQAAAEQAAEAARERAAQAAQAAVAAAPAAASDDAFAQLRYCEAGGDYTRNSGNGYYGAYQYSLSTWSNYDGYARPDLAPADVQDAKAHADQARRGWSPWPACSRKLGLR